MSFREPDSRCTTAVFGGTFDPPHRGHVVIIRTCLERFPRVVLAVTDQNPLKSRRATDHETRREMLRLVLRAEGLPITADPRGFGVYLSEFRYRFTCEFVDYWRANHEPNIAWVIGEDLRDEVATWKDWDRLALPLVIVPELPGIRSTAVRNGQVPAHPALTDFIVSNNLYRAE